MNSLQQLNYYSTQTVAYSAEGSTSTQYLPNRYQINGMIDTSQGIMSNLDKIAGAAASWISYDVTQGKWAININTSGTSIASFNDTNILGDISISGTGLSGLYTGVNVEFPNRDIKDTTDFITIELPSGDLNPNENTNIQNLQYNIINEPIQAQILGLIELKQSRVDIVIKFQTDYSRVGLKAGDLIDVTSTRFGFNQKIFRIITVSETQDDNQSLILDITALEYNSNVYTLTDLYRYTRTDNDGILAIGAIGTPGTPSVIKYENDARPRIVVTSTAPSGIVENMEYWISTNTSILNDDLRTYSLLGVKQPVSTKTFTQGSAVAYEWDGLGTGNFYVKTRGTNSTVSGPFSAPNGFVYTPTQTTNAIGPNTGVLDNTGALLTAFGASLLMNKVSDLLLGKGTTGSLFSSVFDIFKTKTGVDLVGQASSGTLVVAGELGILATGTQITTKTSSINFTGTAVSTVASGDNVTVTINCCSTSTGGSTGTTSTTVTNYIQVISKLPPDRTTYYDPITGAQTDQAPITGSYYLTYGGQTFYGPLTQGTGNAKLYKSDGTLVQTLAASAVTITKNVVEFPFSTRELGTDYYVLIDEGFVKYCDILSAPLLIPTIWNFNTPPYAVSAYSLPSNSYSPIPNLTVTGRTPSGTNVAKNSILTLTWNQPILKGAGNVYIYQSSNDSLVGSISVSSGNNNGNVLTLGSIESYVSPGVSYYITADAGVALSASGDCYINGYASQAITKSNNFTFTVITDFILIDWRVKADPYTGTNLINRQTNIELIYNRPPTLTDVSGAKFSLKVVGGSTYQDFNVTDYFTTTYVSEVLFTSGNSVFINPTKDLTPGTTYYVTGTADSVRDSYGFSWVGLSDTNYVRFTVDSGPTPNLAPIASSDTTITMSFDRLIEAGTGTIKIYDGSNNLIGEIPSTETSITYA